MRVRLEKNGATVVVDGQPIARGGEAAIYPIPGRPDLLGKVYHQATPEQADKLAAMIANPPDDPTAKQGHTSIAWPTDRLFDADAEGRCVGFVMARVEKVQSLLEVYNPKSRLQTWPLFHYGYLLRTARNLAIAVRALHARGYVLGDLNESNVLVNGQTLVTVVDTDSFQTRAGDRVFRCMVGKPEYVAPEIQNANFGDVDRAPEHDHFALGVLIFQLLMQGTHPFAGRFTGQGEPAGLAKRIAAGWWPYNRKPSGPFTPNPIAPPFVVMPPQVRDLMRLCFEDGHGAPAARPDAGRWQKALAEADEQLTECLVNSQHKFHQSLVACPWCELTVKQGRDPFPAKAKAPARKEGPAAPTEASTTTPTKPKPTPAVPLKTPAPSAALDATVPGRQGPRNRPAVPAPSFWATPWPWLIGGGCLAFMVVFSTAAVFAGFALRPSPTPVVFGSQGAVSPSFQQPQFGVNPGPQAGDVGGPPLDGGQGGMRPAGLGAFAPGGLPGAPAGLPGGPGDVLPGGPAGPMRTPADDKPAFARKAPDVLGPDESRIAVVRFAAPSYVFSKDFQSVLALETGGGPFQGGVPGPDGRPPAGPGMNPGRMGNPADMKGAMLGLKFGKRGPTLDPNNFNQDRADSDFLTQWIPLDKLADRKDVTLAEQAYPVRAAEVVAAFPYRKQVKEFRDKLGLAADADVLQDQSGPTPEGQSSAAFRFLGLRVERRHLDAEGSPIGEEDGWKPVDLEGDYKPLLAMNGARTEDYGDLNTLILPGLAMKRIATFGAHRTPPVEVYPAIEKELRNLASTLDALRKVPNGAIGRPGIGRDPGSVFDLNADEPAEGPGSGPGPRGAPPPLGVVVPFGPKGPGGAGPSPDRTDLFLPDHCLIRFFDVTIEPGKTYEYRMKVRMANPNFGRRDVAAGMDAAAELESKDWYVVPGKVTLQPELKFYAMDQKELDANDPLSVPAGPRPIPQAVRSWETTVQIHRWFDYLRTKSHGDLPLGDWAIAERVVAVRGEPLPRPRVEAPYWRATLASFTMASEAARVGVPKPQGPPMVEMPLAADGDEPILVDFTRGDVVYQRIHPKTDAAGDLEQPRQVQDKLASEVLLLTADGRLLAHNAASDALDPDRAARLNAVRAWIAQVKSMRGGKPPAPLLP